MSLTEIAVNILTYNWRNRLRQTNLFLIQSWHFVHLYSSCTTFGIQRWIRQIPHNREEQREVGSLRLGDGRNEADRQQLRCTQWRASQVESGLWEQHRQLSPGPCRGDGRRTGSGKGKYEMTWVASLEVLGKMKMRFSSKRTCADIHSLKQRNNGASGTVYKQNYNELNHGVR